MELLTTDIIKSRIDLISHNHYPDILKYLDFLTYQDNTGFHLTENHIKILKESDKTPLNECTPAKQFIEDLKHKFKK